MSGIPQQFHLLGQSASISSKKITHGELALARSNTCLTPRSLSPTYLFSNSGPLMEMKLARLSFDTAFARSVLPQPGGPYSNTPAGMERPMVLKSCGLRMGSTTLIRSFSRTCDNAPMSSHVVLGTVTKPSRLEEGWTFLSASSKSFMSTASWLSWSSGMAARSLICSATSTRLEMSVLVVVLLLVLLLGLVLLLLVSVGVSGEVLRGSTKRLWKMRLTAMIAASFVVGEGKVFECQSITTHITTHHNSTGYVNALKSAPTYPGVFAANTS